MSRSVAISFAALVLAALSCASSGAVARQPGPSQAAQQAGQPSAAASNSSISGKLIVVAAEGTPSGLPGASVKLTGPAPDTGSQTIVSDADGHYQFDHVAPGTYTLDATEDGFSPFSGMVMVGANQSVAQDITLKINSVSQTVEVHAEEENQATTQSVTPTAEVSNKQLETLPLPTQKFNEALTLVPGVIQTPQGGLSFNGQAESQGMLLVDSAENVDPISGSFAIPVPIDAIQSMTVYSLPQSSAYGGFSGGLTTIETKPPSSLWEYKLLDFIPSFRGKNDHIVGLANLTPRLQVGGPVIANKVNFSEEITYEFRRTPVRGLAWPLNETVTRSTTSFTQMQVIWSPRHLLNVSVNVYPVGIQYANINTLVPQSASTNYDRQGVTAGLNDSYQFDSGALLDTVVRYTRFDSDAYGQGAADMQISPAGWGGNFFNTSHRHGNQLEALPSYQFTTKNWHGRHEIRFGADFLYRDYGGTSVSHPIQILRADGSLAEEIDFQGTGILHAADTEVAEFIDDRWSLDSHLTLNFGARLTSQSIGRDIAFAPRGGIAYALDSRSILRASVAEVYSLVPLLAADFTDNQERVLSFYDTSGALIGSPQVLQNAYYLSGLPPVAPGSSIDPGTSPQTFSWDVEFEHEVNKKFSFRLLYLETYTYNLFVVDQTVNPSSGNGLLALQNNGNSTYHEAQATAHYSPNEKVDLTVSYTWSRGRGDLNTVSDTLVPFAAPVIRPNVSGVLPSDVPQRVVTSGLFRLPKKFVFSPVVDIHSGLPYSNIDVLQDYVGVPDSQRFPTYFSADIKIYREFPLHAFPFMERIKNRRIRIGVYSTDITNRHNPHDVYNNITSPLFGVFAGPQKRIDGIVLDLVQ